MRALVTGATGFLGKAVCLRLKSEGYEVIATGRNLLIGQELEDLGFEFRSVDLSKKDLVTKSLFNKSSYNLIIHCAALTKPFGKYEAFYNSNYLSTKNLIQASIDYKVNRFVNISTPSIYMTHEDRYDICELDQLPSESINFYAHTKKLAEQELNKISKNHLSWISLRPQAIFGPGDKTLMPRIINLAKHGKYPKIGEKPVWIDMTYIDNILDAVLLAANKKNINSEHLNITNGEPIIIAELFEKIFRRLKLEASPKKISYQKAYKLAQALELMWKLGRFKSEPPITRYAVCALGKSRTLSIRRAQKLLGYQPKISLTDGLDKTLLLLS